MNFVRRIVHSKTESNTQSRVSANVEGDQSVNYLKSLFCEYKIKNTNSTNFDIDDVLYNIVPVFHKIFLTTPGQDICERFPDVFSFCTCVSSLMVKEIKKRATNQKTEEASLAIVQFLQPAMTSTSNIKSTDESRGWMLLNVINILSRGPAPLLDCMISAGLSSTLVKCLYIFFDLPNVDLSSNSQSNDTSTTSVMASAAATLFTGTSSTSNINKKCNSCDPLGIHKRNILMDNFKQILQRICSYPPTTEELVRKEDLRLLFGAVASWCPPHNSGWRKAAADILQTIAHSGLSQDTIQHIYHKKLISQCLKNVTKGGLDSMEIVDIFVTLFHLLRESSEINQMLLDDFRNSQGYAIIEEFLIKLEKEISNENEQDSIRSLIILIGKLTTCGYVELRPKQSVTNDIIYQIESFELPMPLNKNESIRNYYAFNVLQSVFMHAESDFLCIRILEGIKTIYKQDPANYFILEPQNTFQVFSEKISKKSPVVQEQFLDIIDCIVTTLNYVPIKEISSLTVIMKTCNVAVTKKLLIQTFIRLTEYHKIFKEVLHDLGILELSVNQLHSYAYTLQTESDQNINGIEQLGLLIMDFLCLLINGMPKNVDLFRKVGGNGCMYSLVHFPHSQSKALDFIRILSLTSGSEEDMTGFMSLVRSSPPHNIKLKIEILHALFLVLKDSHRCRIVFRKVHSFVLLVQELVHLEGCLSIPTKPQWEENDKIELFQMVQQIFDILTIALRREPSNVRHFSLNVGYGSLTEAVRNLGCFGTDVDLVSQDDNDNIQQKSPSNTDFSELFQEIFNSQSYAAILSRHVSNNYLSAVFPCILFKFLYEHAIENLNQTSSGKIRKQEMSSKNSNPQLKDLANSNYSRYAYDSVNSQNNIPIIIHVEAVVSLLHLIPAVRSDSIAFEVQLQLQVFIMERIRTLFQLQRNVQLMSDIHVCMPQELLSCFNLAIVNEIHPLHNLTLILFEKLVSNKISPKNLRDFLRLSSPLCCQNALVTQPDTQSVDIHKCGTVLCCISLHQNNSINHPSLSQRHHHQQQMCRENGGPVALERVKSLIGISTQNQHTEGDRAWVPMLPNTNGVACDSDSKGWGANEFAEMRPAQVPCFVEMNMKYEGFSCLFLPSIAPQSISSTSGVSSVVGLGAPLDSNTLGGIGLGERVFPPTSGFSYSCWFSVQKFNNPHQSPHPIRLLTLVRNIHPSNESLCCLAIWLRTNSNTGACSIVVSTMEDVLSMKYDYTKEIEQSEYIIEFPCESLISEHSWTHSVLTFHRSGMIKHSSCSCFINGQLIGTKKLNYISSSVTAISSSHGSSSSAAVGSGSSVGGINSLITSVHAYIGTVPNLHRISNVCWRQGPCHLVEEPLSPNNIAFITRLGPNYCGNFQNPLLDYKQPIGQLVAEEKVVFSLFANQTSIFTLPKINKIYNEIDTNSIARQLHLHPKEKSSPIRIVHNAAGNLSGPARTLGAVLIGYEGIRSFAPAPLSSVLDCVGGAKILLGFLAMANDAEYLYAVVKAICSILSDNRHLLKELEHSLGYKLMNFLLKRKRHLLSSRILSLLISLTGSSDQDFFPDENTVMTTIMMESRNKHPQKIINIAALNRSFNRKLFNEIVCDLDLWIHCDDGEDNSKHQLLVNALRHITEFFQKCLEASSLASSSQSQSITNVSDGSDKDSKINSIRSNSILRFLLEMNLIEKLTIVLMHFHADPFNKSLVDNMSLLIKLILTNTNKPEDLRRLGQFMVWTLSPLGTTEAVIDLPADQDIRHYDNTELTELQRSIYLIEFRNICFRVLLDMLDTNENDIVEPKLAEELIKYLGYDWIALFLQPEVHSTTVILATRCLFNLLIIPGYMGKFRDGIMCSGWLSGTDTVLKKRHGLLLMENSRDQNTSLREINLESCHQPGFVTLQSLLPYHCKIPDIYFILIALLLGNKIKTIPENLKFEFEAVCNFLFGGTNDSSSTQTSNSGTASNTHTKSSSSIWGSGPIGGLLSRMDSQMGVVGSTSSTNKESASGNNKKSNIIKKPVEMCPEAATILLTMMRVMLNQNCLEKCDNDKHDWIRDYPITLLRFFVYLYHSNIEFQGIAMQPDFLVGLTCAMFPTAELSVQKHFASSLVTTSIGRISSPDVIDLKQNDSCRNSITSNNQDECIITQESLNAQPARKLIMDFFKMIILDSFTLPTRGAPQHIIDVIFDTDLDASNNEHVKQFYTIFINNLTEHFLAVDILCGQNLPLPTGGNYSLIPHNIHYFIARVVDKVWQDIYCEDTDVVLSFVIRLIVQAKKRNLTSDPLYRSFNRLLLHKLSKLCLNQQSRNRSDNSLNILKSFIDFETNSESLGHYIFNQSNNDLEFFVCLTQILIQLATGTNIVGGTIWYNRAVSSESQNMETDTGNVVESNELSQVIDQMWKNIYAYKRPLLEEFLKTQLSPNLNLVSANIEQVCTKTWTNFLENETNVANGNGSYTSIWGKVVFPSKENTSNVSGTGSNVGLHHQISMKFNRLSRSSVLSRLGNSSSVTYSSSGSGAGINNSGHYPSSIGTARLLAQVSLEDAKLWVPPHISVVKELTEYYKNDYIKKESFMMHYLESNWKKIETELTRERGIWGPMNANPLDKWMLDSAEGPCRMRKKFVPNDMFYDHYPYRRHKSNCDNSENGCSIRKFKAASSWDSKAHFELSISRAILKEMSCHAEENEFNDNVDQRSLESKSLDKEDVDLSCIPHDDPEESLRTTASLLRSERRTSLDPSSLGGVQDRLSTFEPTLSTSRSIEGLLTGDLIGQKIDEDDVDVDDGIEKDTTSGDNVVCGNDSELSIEKLSPTDPNTTTASTVTTTTNATPNTSTGAPNQRFNRESFKNNAQILTPSWDNQAAIEHMIGLHEKIHFMFRCARIQGLDVHEGLLLFGQNFFYIIDGFTLLKTREIVEIDNIPSDVHEPIIPQTSSSPGHLQNRTSSEKFSFEEIREIHKRRYLLQPIAVEVFLADGRNFLLAFPKKMQAKIYSKFIQVSPSLTLNSQQSVSGQRQNSKIETGTAGLFSSLMGEKSVTQRWERGEMSNFQYLMHLNTLAGRSYNDLMQYPVFPWVLADYDSDTLDLHNPNTFRQLDKPMGAQSQSRLLQFQKRYREWDDPSGETPPYHYGTHYSSAMIVAFYLVRMEPFTQHFLKLQGGHFDLADRMFHSIRDTWESASQHNMADIKELIPEFFYLPNFLENSNRFDLGSKQNGTALDDIILPPWAKGDPREFIRAHREALECDYVSAHLNEWIDLIFGYKQVGDPAVEAVNVFHHLFYEGNVDIYSINDPLKRSAVVGFINNFGQIPKQLFKKPHPSKKLSISHLTAGPSGLVMNKQMLDPMAPVASSNTAERLFYYNLDNLEPSLQPVKELKSAVGQIIQQDSGSSTSSTVSITSNTILAVEQNKCLIPPTYSRYIAWGFLDGSLRIGSCDSDKLVKVYEMPDPHGDIMCVVCPNDKTLVTGGVSTVVRVWSMVLPGSSLSSVMSGSGSGGLVGSGSAAVGSGTNSNVGQSSSNNNTSDFSPTLILRANLYGHRDAVTCMTAATAHNLLITGSRDRSCIVWDLARLCFLRQLLPAHPAPVAALCVSEAAATVASCAGTHLRVWSGHDGLLLASVNTATGRSKQILSVAMSTMMDWDPGNVIITGGTDGVVRMWSLEYIQVPLANSNSDTISAIMNTPTTPNDSSNIILGDGGKEYDTGASRTTNRALSSSGIGGGATSGIEEDFDDEDMSSRPDTNNSTVVIKSNTGPAESIERIYQQDSSISTTSSPTEQGEKSDEKGGTLTRSKSAITPDSSNKIRNRETTTSGDGGDDEDYVVIGSSELDEQSPNNNSDRKKQSSMKALLKSMSQPQLRNDARKLRKGFQWQRQLIFRSKLTMHTAYERADNASPSPVSAVAVSRDHRAVLVGDQRGRVFCWTVPNEPGRSVADHWLRDETAEVCGSCRVKFSLTERRHHCRNCGRVFCSKCSKYEIEIHRLRLFKPVRVCYKCYNSLNQLQNTKSATNQMFNMNNNNSNSIDQSSTLS